MTKQTLFLIVATPIAAAAMLAFGGIGLIFSALLFFFGLSLAIDADLDAEQRESDARAAAAIVRKHATRGRIQAARSIC